MVCFKKRNTIKNKKQKIIMADQQKIHPVVDVEAPPTAPLVPQGSAMSEKGTMSTQQQHPPLQQPNKDGYCSCSFCKCVCWTISVLVLLLIIIAGIVGIVYLVFQPKLPKYSVESLRISDLRLNFDLSLYARFDVKVTASNPNKKIGIYYEKGGRLSVWYTKTKLCQGSLPKFYQGHQNITKLDVALTGQTQYGNTLMNALQEQQQTGQIPLDLKVEAPVAIKLGKLKLMKVRILGECLLVVDSLTTNNVISIKASNCRFKLKL
ncbi:hypothetical protein EZV62_024302 [Acer yangbiense]|uniref:Late embryogenesis abundant protein LEA-2 subgroup domain-containing protein n=1 Tax=Acer yangbiense TaxID=1000413 RepID=A0A5C7H461_9ROSI|nr:hypothetical protein EZV62_024302 [Acer yangbiense]